MPFCTRFFDIVYCGQSIVDDGPVINFNLMKVIYGIAVITGLVLLGAGCLESGSTPRTSNAPSTAAPASTSVIRLDLSGSGLESIPSYVFKRTELEELDLSDNRLTGALPAEIRNLRNLRVLDASRNQMTGVPAEVGQLSELQYLDLSDNKLTGLPLELGNLRNLRRLDLRGNNPSSQDLDAIRSKLNNTEILL